jgi:hypothetical protein
MKTKFIVLSFFNNFKLRDRFAVMDPALLDAVPSRVRIRVVIKGGLRDET